MNYKPKFSVLSAVCIILTIGMVSCKDPNPKEKIQQPEINEQHLKDQFVKANQQLVQKENDEMDFYAKSHQMTFVPTKSGIRYFVYQPSAKGDSIKDGMDVTLEFKVSLMNGDEVYSSAKTGKKTVRVGQDNVESGIHKGLLYLKRGDKALLLIPSHLAHGLLGDQNKIPPQMPIVYDLQID